MLWMFASPIGIVTVLFFALWIVVRYRKVGSRESGFAPGPPTVPILGNIPIFPTKRAHLK